LYAFLITLIQLSGGYLIFGCWLEEYEAIFQNFFAGIYTEPPFELVYIDVYGGIIPLLCRLAEAAYPYPVNEYLQFAVVAACCFVINYCALNILAHTRASKVSFIITIGVLNLIVFPQFTVLLNCTRVSVLAGIAAFFAASWFYMQGRKNLGGVLLVILLLTASSIERSFTAFFTTTLLLVLSFILWKLDFFKNRLGWIFIAFFFIQAGLIAGLLNYRAHSNHPAERYVMTYEYAVTNRGDLTPLPSGASRQDSIRYELLRNWLVTDTVAINESYLRKFIRHVTVGDILSDKDYVAEQFGEAITLLTDFSRQYSYALIAIIGFILIMPFRQRIQGLSWAVIVMAMLMLLTIAGSMFHRAFAPFICLLASGLWVLWVLWSRQSGLYRKNVLYLLLLFTIVASFFSIRHLLEIRKENLRLHQAFRQFSQTALQLDSLYPVMMQSADMVMFAKKTFEKFPPRAEGNIIVLNAGYHSFFKFFNRPYREKYNLDITNGQSVAGFIRSRNEKGVVLLTTSDGCKLFKDYLHAFFGLDIDVESLDVPPVESPQHTLYFFRIKAA